MNPLTQNGQTGIAIARDMDRTNNLFSMRHILWAVDELAAIAGAIERVTEKGLTIHITTGSGRYFVRIASGMRIDIEEQGQTFTEALGLAEAALTKWEEEQES